MQPGPTLTESGRYKPAMNKSSSKVSGNIPPAFFLALAGGAFILSMGLAASRKRRRWANFTGLWVPTILLLGIYDRVMGRNPSESERSQTLLH